MSSAAFFLVVAPLTIDYRCDDGPFRVSAS
jgi:hypothetical protein